MDDFGGRGCGDSDRGALWGEALARLGGRRAGFGAADQAESVRTGSWIGVLPSISRTQPGGFSGMSPDSHSLRVPLGPCW